jgi:orotate phosphoribosyltransferase
LGNQVEGYFEPGKRVVVVEDLISTGKSSLQVCGVLKEQGLKVEGMVSIFTYGFDVAATAFAEAGVPLKSLTNYETLISLALEKGIVGTNEEVTLLNWRRDPAHWQG